LGGEAPLQVQAPTPAVPDEVLPVTEPYLCLTCADPKTGFAAVLEVGWLPMLSAAMLGEPLTIDDPDYLDLMTELGGQAYSTIRTQFSTMGVEMPEAAFTVVPPGEAVQADTLPAELVTVPFSMVHDEETYQGFILMRASALEAAEEAAGAARQGDLEDDPVDVAPIAFQDLGDEVIGGDGGSKTNLGLLADVELEIRVELGRRQLPLADLILLTVGSVVELDKLVGEPLDIYANGRQIAEGEAVVIEEQFGIRITRLMGNRKPEVAFRA
jgi:flagellar motor switch protein FliN/FliY